VPLVVRERLQEPKHIEEWQVELDKKKFGPRFKKDGKAVEAAVEALTQDLREKLSLDLKNEGKITVNVPGVSDGKVDIEKDLITIEKRTRVEHVREYVPNGKYKAVCGDEGTILTQHSHRTLFRPRQNSLRALRTVLLDS
jgi:glycyl-tRNA synthetase